MTCIDTTPVDQLRIMELLSQVGPYVETEQVKHAVARIHDALGDNFNNATSIAAALCFAVGLEVQARMESREAADNVQ